MTAEPVRRCRSCGRADPQAFLSLGETPIANALVTPERAGRPDPVHVLEVGFCSGCTLVQLTHELPAAAIFDADYVYYSSFSDMLLRHSAAHVDELVSGRGLGAGSFVLEVASNDGYLLRRFVEHGVPVLGVEPTPGPAAAARAAGVPTREAFFGRDLAREIRDEHGPADVVVANNVMAHVPALNDFVAGLAHLVADDGVVRIENPGVRYLLEHNEFDTVYHEHFCYFSTLAVEVLLAHHGLVLVDVEHFPDLHGGTLRWTAAHHGAPSGRARDHLAAERALGLDGFEAYRDFGRRVERTQTALRELLVQLRAEGASVAAYGAAAKGATLLNSSGIDHTLVDFVVDRNVHKQGKLMPGARLPIVDPAELVSRRPDYVLLLAWNVRDEVMRQQATYREGGGRFIVPVPEPTVL